MKLESIFDQLTHGELSQVFIGGGEQQGITPENRRNIISHINLGLTELHKRFLLKEGRLTIVPPEAQFTYIINSKYAQSNTESTETMKYIEDSDNPFEDNLLKIERVYDHKGIELALNDIDNEESVRTPSYNMLVLPLDHKHEQLTVVYRANHPTLDTAIASYSPDEVEVDLPMSHLEPLLLYVASRVMNPVGLSNEFHEGNNYATKFEQACQRIDNFNYRVDMTNGNSKLVRNGWV